MGRFIARLLFGVQGAESTRSQRDDAASRSRDVSRETIRALAAALDRAMTLGLWEHAERVATTAMRVASAHPMLCERLARLRLARRDPEAALNVIDSSSVPTASLRMARTICLLQLGRKFEAHLELQEWATKSSAPLIARRLLSLLEWEAGDADAARAALLCNLKQIEDPHTLALLALINTGEGDREQAARWADRLKRCDPLLERVPHLGHMLATIDLGFLREERAEPSPDRIATLATELLAVEVVIPALVESQRLQPQPPAARLMMLAIERILPELEDVAAGYVALAQLNLALDDATTALAWVQNGLKQCPMSATLARMAGELQQGQTAPAARERAA